MKLVILVPSEDYKGNAGARIRYGRVAPRLEEQGVTVALEEISKFNPRTADCDVMVVSKCYDARSLVAAEVLSRRGVRVGVDLFDDYFSQLDDSRLIRFRSWLRQMLVRADFAMCSTKAMEVLVGGHAPDCPVHVLSDPAPAIDEQVLADRLRGKLAETHAAGRFHLAWFGVGDNPNFAVGLSDLSAFSGVIRRLASHGMPVDLSVLTNARALDARRLAMISELPASAVTVDEWSESAEAELLGTALACILPVNAQGFSRAKSLNRAITALAAGCQVLAVGYPLYAPLESLIYTDPDLLAQDLRNGRFRLSPETVDAFRATILKTGSQEVEADSLLRFLEGVSRLDRPTSQRAPLYLVHGVNTNGSAHKMTQSVGGLSIATPFCTTQLNFDVRFERRAGGGLAMQVSDQALSKMLPKVRGRAVPCEAASDRNFWEIRDAGPAISTEGAVKDPPIPLELALYSSVIESVVAAVHGGFGAGTTIVSETSPLPFTADWRP